jgi:hypothetical protein
MMHTVIATLQRAAQQRQAAGALNRARYGKILAQLREIADELSPSERRRIGEKWDPVNFAELLRSVAKAAAGGPHPSEILVQAPEGVLVHGPEHDLRELIGTLTEFARGVGAAPVEVRASVTHGDDQDRAKCVTELVIQERDVPDFLRRKLWEVVSARRGEVSIASEAHRCRVEFSLPIERRVGTVLG